MGGDAAGAAGGQATHSWDFSKVPVFAPVHGGDRTTASEPALAGRERDQDEIAPEVQSAVERKRGGGQPLGDGTRHRMEGSFDADFSAVRVHADAEAGSLARAIDATAFTTGKDVFFGQGTYNPDSARGRELLAHELTHVVQQNGSPAPSNLVLGEPGDRCEREAGAVAKRIAVAPGQPAMPGAASRLSPSSSRAVQRDPIKTKPAEAEPAKAKPAETRPAETKPAQTESAGPKPVKTWAGEFSAPGFVVGLAGKDNYGADIEISFAPGKSVDAESIALVQTAQSYQSGRAGHVDPLDDVPQPETVKTEKDQEVFKSRMLDDMIGLGTHIDAPPQSRTPLSYTNRDPKSKDESLASSVPNADYKVDPHDESTRKHVQFGWRTPKKGAKPAQMGDIPRLTVAQGESASQRFETTALAIEGVQKGAYYGSVQWGWTKQADTTEVEPIDFQLSKDASPSPAFFKAAEKWNVSQDSAEEASIPLPISSNKAINKQSDLVETPDKPAKHLARLDRDTPVGTLEDSSHPDWVRLVVTGGGQKGKIGWVKASQLSEPKSDLPTKKKEK